MMHWFIITPCMCAQKVIYLLVVVNDELSVSLSHHMTVSFKQ